MGNTKVILNILDSALSLWNSKEKTKYIDEKIKLEKKYYDEFNKQIHDPSKPYDKMVDYRSDAILDSIHFELCILSNNAAAAIRAANAKA